MALTTDERERLAAALAETPGALEALTLMATEAGRMPVYAALADTLVQRVLARAGVPPVAPDEFAEIGRPLCEQLPEVRAYTLVFDTCRAQGAPVPPALARDLARQLARSLVAKLGGTPPPAPAGVNPPAC